jgi:ATP-dependent Clp protease adapter protein ClpS
MAPTATDTDLEALLGLDIDSAFDDLYNVVVLDDDVTSFQTVIVALVVLFEFEPEAAWEKANEVHTTGRAVATVCPKDEAERGVRGLHGFKIQAKIEPAGKSADV